MFFDYVPSPNYVHGATFQPSTNIVRSVDEFDSLKSAERYNNFFENIGDIGESVADAIKKGKEAEESMETDTEEMNTPKVQQEPPNENEDEEITVAEAGERWSSVDSSEEYNEKYHPELSPENNEYSPENYGVSGEPEESEEEEYGM